MVSNTITPAEQESLWLLKNSWSRSKGPSWGKTVELRPIGKMAQTFSLTCARSHCSSWYFQRWPQQYFVPCASTIGMTFYPLPRGLSLILPAVNLEVL